MASDALRTRATQEETHYNVKWAFEPTVLRYRKLTLLTFWELRQTEVGGLLEPPLQLH